MHMADALLSPEVAAGMYVASAAAAAISVAKIRKQENAPSNRLVESKMPTMAVMSALVFAGQMINYTIPGTGSSGHLCGGMLLAALLGPFAGFLSMIVVLGIQCLFFADGGLMALGANIWNMAFYGCFVGYYLIYRPIMRGKLFKGAEADAGKGAGKTANGKTASRKKIALSSVLGCIITLQLGAFSVVLETSLSGITELPFSVFVVIMQPIHLAIGLVEGLITSAVLLFIYEARPELVSDLQLEEGQQGKEGQLEEGQQGKEGQLEEGQQGREGQQGSSDRMSLKGLLLVLAIVVIMLGGGLSLYASSNPDGLEWSIAKMGVELPAQQTAVQEATAFLPDYEHTSLSGLLGSAMVAATAAVLCIISAGSKKTIKRQKKDRSFNRAENAKEEFKSLDELTAMTSAIHRLPPLVKLLATVAYIVGVMSFNKYNILGLFPMVLIPLVLYVLSHISPGLCFYKLRIVMPLVCAVGIVNPFIDRAIVVYFGSLGISGGVISMLTLMMKGVFSLMMSFLLVATTPVDEICRALRQLHCPKMITSLLMLTFRYISVLLEEVAIMTAAYHLRAPRQKGVEFKAWGSFLGQLILRSMDRAEAIYNSMQIRGFNGEFHYADKSRKVNQ